MNSKSRLFIITGKGGVGKTTVAFSLVNKLIANGTNAKYLNFQSSSINKQKPIINKFHLPAIDLNLVDCATEYVARKMKSQTIASWIIKTPFFKALINMLPGFSYLIYLGKTMDLLEEDPNLVLVLDSPSSGHALTMFESMKNYQEIFQTGLLFEDTKKVIEQLYSPNFTKTIILTIPTMMALNEGIELNKSINDIREIETQIFCNNILSKIQNLNIESLPQILKEKINIEKEVLNHFQSSIDATIGYCIETESEKLLESISNEIGNLL